MRVRYVVEVPDFKRLDEVTALIEKFQKVAWQEVSGQVVGFLIERAGVDRD